MATSRGHSWRAQGGRQAGTRASRMYRATSVRMESTARARRGRCRLATSRLMCVFETRLLSSDVSGQRCIKACKNRGGAARGRPKTAVTSLSECRELSGPAAYIQHGARSELYQGALVLLITKKEAVRHDPAHEVPGAERTWRGLAKTPGASGNRWGARCSPGSTCRDESEEETPARRSQRSIALAALALRDDRA